MESMLPILYQNKDLVIYSYPLLMGLGWGVGHQIFFSSSDLPHKFKQLLFWGLFLFSWLGSKLLFVLNTKDIQASILTEANFWTGGGFVFYGGFIFSLIFLLFYKQLKLPFNLKTLRALILAAIFGHAIGRLGCFLAGCCFGHITDKWWGINIDGVHRYPTQLLESLSLFMLGLLILKKVKDSYALPVYLISYGVIRIFIEYLRGDDIRGIWGPLSPSQWISIALIFMGVRLISRNNFNSLS
jgi:phosphatidylglycerol:prolipoprotein diacylglycerol transferase